MSIGGILRTSVSGMNSQANRLSAVSENIANSSTTGYKRAVTEFSSLVLQSGSGEFNSGVVSTQTRNLISQQGGLQYTSNASSSQAIDLAVQGKGFFVVGDGSEGKFLTRAGSFVKDGSGNLINAAGFTLQGYKLPMDDTNAVANGYAGLSDVNLNAAELRLKPTTLGQFRVNLLKEALPAVSANHTQTDAFDIAETTAGASVTGDRLKFTVNVDGTGYAVDMVTDATIGGGSGVDGITAAQVADAVNAAVPGTDIIATVSGGKLVLTSKNAVATAGSVALSGVSVVTSLNVPLANVTVAGLEPFNTVKTTGGTLPSANAADAKPTTSESIVVYDDTGKEVILDIHMTKTTTNTWEYAIYDRAGAGTGATAPFPYTSAAVSTTTVTFNEKGGLLTPADGSIQFNIPGGQPMALSLTGTSQLSSPYQPLAASVNGNPPGNIDKIVISADGIVSATFGSGEDVPLFKIPLALVESPDNMTSLSGNVYSAGLESGSVLVGFGGSSGLGSIVSGALEQSTVDLASELTTMIESQRSYTANSKVFQTGSEILDVLVNLKR